jgi:threonine synthase
MNETIPDRIFVPVGDGVIISGVYKGYEDLLKMGFIKKMPVIVAVQSEGSKNIAANIDSEEFTIYPSKTIADSISVDIPRNFFMAKDFLKKYNGETVLVSDEEIIKSSKILSNNTGLFSEPASVTSFAGFLKYKSENRVGVKSKNVVLLTGSGLKDLNSVQSLITIPEAVKPEK